MGIYTRPDSPYWWLWLETAAPGQAREKTKILVGTTRMQRRDSRALAMQRYTDRMHTLAAHIHQFPTAPENVITFATFAPWYDAHHIEHHAGREREREILPRLIAGFGHYRLHEITKAIVRAWRTARRARGAVVEDFGRRQTETLPKWAQIHAWLVAHGPSPLAAIKVAFGLTTRNVSRTYLTPETSRYFERQQRGVWTAIGVPVIGGRKIYPPPSARTVNREIDLLQQILAAGVDAGHLEVSPLYGLDDLDTIEPIRRIMSEDEELAVLQHLRPDDRAIFLAGLHTLARMVDILDFKWADDHGDTMDIVDPKNGKSHTVPIARRWRAALDALPRTGVYMFPKRRLAKTAAGRRATIAYALKRACARAHVPYGRALRGLTFHWSTRRTGATRMIQRGGEKAVGVVQKIGGWEDPSVLIGIYQETITADMRAAVETVEPEATPVTLPRRRKSLKLLRKRA